MNNSNSDIIKLVRAASGMVDPCYASLKWLSELPAETTPEQAWGLCPDATWLFWISGKIGIDKVLITLSMCDIAESVLHLVTPGEDRPRLAIETARAWARGEASLEDVQKTANAARTAAYAATRDAAYASHTAARSAAHAASSASYASSCAARVGMRSAASDAIDAAYTSSYAADAFTYVSHSAYATSRANSLSRSADHIRVWVPWSLVAKRLAVLKIVV